MRLRFILMVMFISIAFNCWSISVMARQQVAIVVLIGRLADVLKAQQLHEKSQLNFDKNVSDNLDGLWKRVESIDSQLQGGSI